jgi:hypothetical protein
MGEPRVRVFFYGSYMNPAVLREVGIVPEAFEVARLDGYDIRIAPRANLVPSQQHNVYGVLVEATHAELDRLYAHARDVLGETYLPHPVLTKTVSAGWFPALCYIAPAMVSQRADPAYLERIVKAARDFGLPSWYIERLESAAGGE